MNTIERRKFLQVSALGLVAGSTATADGLVPVEPQKKVNASVQNEVDVLVVGGGTAGVIAAIQAARAGAKTMVVERGAQLGGTTTTGGVAWPGLFDAWGKQVIAGIGWELVKESVELDGGRIPDFAKVPAKHYHNQVPVNQFLYALLAEEKCEAAGVEIAYYEFPTEVIKTSDGWTVKCAGFGTERTVNCKQIVDTTGGAEVVGLMGGERLREAETQPGSYLFMIGKDLDAGRAQCQRLYVHGADSTNSRTVTRANLTGRKSVLARLRSAIQKHGHVQLQHLQPETSFRESYRILGETVITVNDYTSGKQFEDAICNAFYPVDLHTKTGVRPKKLKPGVIPTVPLSALVPKDSSNVLVAGRCVSSDRLANSGLRVQASCMAMGQAAGAAAALAVQKQLTPGALPLDELKALLKEHGAILAGESMTVQASEAEGDAVTASSGSGLLFDAGAAAAVGVWKKGNSKATIGSSYLHDDNQGKGAKSLTFTIPVTEPGSYAIRFHYNTHTTRSSCTPVSVKIGGKVHTFSVDQRQSDGRGFVLGTFDIQDRAIVTISNDGTDGHVIADGLELIKK
ncbi:MAG: FAD-dependent oxidoreductase [Coraliomargarita sp.]